MLNNFIYAETKDLFLEQLNAGNILDEAIVFIKDTREIWNHGTYFKCNAEISGGMSDEEIISIVEQEAQRAQQVESDIISKLQILIGTDAWDSVRNLIKDELDTQLKSDDISESFDTIKEIAEYLSNNPSVAIEVEKSIKELQENKADKATTLAGYGITDALPLSGGKMTGYIRWQDNEEGGDVADWNAARSNYGLRIMSSAAASIGAPTDYATALQVRGRYGFQIASRGGETDMFYIKNISRFSREWNELYHTGNFNPANYLPLSGGTLSGVLILNNRIKLRGNIFEMTKSDGKGGVYLWDGDSLGYNNRNLYIFNGSAWNETLHSGNYSSYALPLSGGTITGELQVSNPKSGQHAISIGTNNGTAWMGYNADNGLWFVTDKKWQHSYTLIHSGNIESQSVSYASSAGSLTLAEGSSNVNRPILVCNPESGKVYYSSAITINYALQELAAPKFVGALIGNAGSATKLQTARTIWGQSFDGTDNINGDITLGQNHIKFNNFTITPTSLAFVTGSGGWSRGLAIKSQDGNILSQIGMFGDADLLKYVYLTADQSYNSANSLRLWDNGNVTIGKTTNTSGYKLQVEGSALFTGDILLDNNRNIYFKNSEGASVPLITLNSGNIFAIGYGNIAKGYDTRIFGANIHFCYTETATAFYVSRLGNVIVNNDIYMKNTKSIYFKDTSDNYHALLSLTENNILKLGVGNHTTNIYGNNIEMFTGTQEPAIALRITDNKDVTVFGILDVNGNIVLHAGNYTDYTGTSSDRSLKSEINTITDSEALSVLTQLNPVTFIWNAVATSLKPSLIGESSGFISDEYESVIPNSGYDMWDKQYRGIDYTRVSSYLVAGWQNHERRISDMEDKTSEIDKLKKIIEDATQKISELESQLNNN